MFASRLFYFQSIKCNWIKQIEVIMNFDEVETFFKPGNMLIEDSCCIFFNLTPTHNLNSFKAFVLQTMHLVLESFVFTVLAKL